MTSNLALPTSCPVPNCPLGQPVAVHTHEIATLHEAQCRIEAKLDRLMWGIIGALSTSTAACAGIIVGLLRK